MNDLRQLLARARELGRAERHEDAVALLEPAFAGASDPEAVDELEHAFAWALLHAGQANDALVIAADRCARIEASGGRAPAEARSLLGMALLATGDEERARAVLTDDLGRAIPDDWARSAHFLRRGDASGAGGDQVAARTAWLAARDADPEGSFGREAVRRLGDPAESGPYRRR